MRHPLRLLPVFLALIIAYLLIFPISTGEELIIHREWAATVRSAPIVTTDRTQLGPLMPVAMADSFAYVTEQGSVVHRGMLAHRVALSPDGYISFGRNPDQLVVQNTDGSFRATIPQSGYPQFSGDRLFVRSGGDTVVTAYSSSGESRWRAELEGQVASITSRSGISLLSLLSGGIVVINDFGERIEVQGVDNRFALTAYGGAIHGPTSSVVAVYGPADPVIMLYRLTAGLLVPALRVQLSGNPGRQIAVAIADDGQQLLVDDHGVRIIEVASGTQTLIPAAYRLVDIETESDSGLMMTLGIGDVRDPEHSFRYPVELITMDHTGIVPVRAVFGADRAELSTQGGSSYLTTDDRVLKFALGVE